MKRMLVFLSLCVPILQSSVAFAAGSATVTLLLKNNNGAAISGQQITCTTRPPQSGPMPVPPQFTYLTADANGMVTWRPDVVDGATYRCSPRTTQTPDACFTWGSNTTGDMALVDGENKSFTFTAAPTGTCNTPPPATATQPTANNPTQQQSSSAALSPPEITRVMLDGKEITAGKTPQIKAGQSFVLEGRTVPNATVVVTVHSDPITSKVAADGAGLWKFAISSLKELEPGNHQVEVSAIDAESGKESVKRAVLSFSFVSAEDKTKNTSKSPSKASEGTKKSNLLALMLAAAVILLLGGLGWYLWHRNHMKSASRRR